MNVVSLPALDGRSPLGFLAALGVLRLLDRFTEESPRLAWAASTMTAEIHSSLSSVDEVVDRIQQVVDSIPDEGVIPGVPVDFPVTKVGSKGGDPMRPAPEGLRAMLTELESRLGPGEELAEVEAWVSSLVTDLTSSGPESVGLGLFLAPSGQMTTRSMFSFPLKHVRENPLVLREALVSWRRYPGVTGEYLDHQAMFSAVDAVDGKSEMRGVPGATWLALMSYPYFSTTADGSHPVTTGWFRRPRQQTVLMYPLWSAPLRPRSVVALMEHKVVAEHVDVRTGLSPELRAMGVFELCRHARRPMRNSRGVLGPVV